MGPHKKMCTEISSKAQDFSRENKLENSNVYVGRKMRYLKLDRLGNGTYARVYRGKCIENGAIVAIKEIKIDPDEGAPSTAIREISLMMQLKHRNVVEILDVIFNSKQLAIIVQYMESDLKAFMIKYGGFLPPTLVKKLMYDLLSGLAACHAQKILHRDLKPQNLLISSDVSLKIGDFGLGRSCGIPTPSYSCEVVTLWYRPPDVLMGSTKYCASIDIWSAGCVMAEMLTGCVLFQGECLISQLMAIFNLTGPPTEANWPNAAKLSLYRNAMEAYKKSKNFKKRGYRKTTTNITKSLATILPNLESNTLNLLCSMLQIDPDARITAFNALKHPYFNDLPKV